MVKVFVAWLASELGHRAQGAITGNSPEELRRLQQASDHADQIWQSWAMANDGSVISCEPGQGVLEIGPEKLKEIMAIHTQYSQAIGSSVCIGIGTRMAEALEAVKQAQGRGDNQIALFSAETKEPEAGLAKEEPSIPSLPVEVPKPSIPSLPVIVPIQQRLNDLAAKQHQADDEHSKRQADGHDELKSQLAVSLQMVKDQLPVLLQLKDLSPEAHQAVLSLVNSVISMGRAIQPHHVVLSPTSEE